MRNSGFDFKSKIAFRHFDAFSGWWSTDPSEKYEFVNWDDFQQKGGNHLKKKRNVPKHHYNS